MRYLAMEKVQCQSEISVVNEIHIDLVLCLQWWWCAFAAFLSLLQAEFIGCDRPMV